MSKYIAVRMNDEVIVHLPGAIGDYATLCGLDGNDDSRSVDQHPTDVPRNAKVNCAHCSALWKTARRYSAKDFSTEGMR